MPCGPLSMDRHCLRLSNPYPPMAPCLQRPSCAACARCWPRQTPPGRHPGLAGSPTTPPTPAPGSAWTAGSGAWLHCEPGCGALRLHAAESACPRLALCLHPLTRHGPNPMCMRCRRLYEDRHVQGQTNDTSERDISPRAAAAPAAPASPPGTPPWGPLLPELAQLERLEELEMQRLARRQLVGAIPPEWCRAGAFPSLRK